jgi:hypothetical protein
MEQTWYDDIIAGLETFDDVFPTLTSFTTNLTSYNEVDGITITSEFKSFVYYALQYNFKTDKIAYETTTDEDGADMFKKRLAITFYEEAPRLQKTWQLVLAKLETTVSEEAFNRLKTFSSASTNIGKSIATKQGTETSQSSLFNEQSGETKSAETPAQIYSTPQNFIDKYTNSMEKSSATATNNQSQNSSTADTQSGETKDTLSGINAEIGGTRELFSMLSTIPKGVLMQVAQPFAKHFVSIYFN